MSRSYRLSIVLGIGLVASACVQDAEVASKSGKFAVNDYQLAYHCAGSGSPTVFLEPPSGISAEEAFANVFDQIARTSKVCRFERLGFGQSDPVPENLNQTVKDYSDELGALVKRESESEQIVLVGYSFGGFIARYYAASHPEQVRSLLLIDAAHEDWLQEMKVQMSVDDWAKMQGILDWFLENRGHNYWDSQFEVAETELREDLPIRIVSRGQPHETIREAGVSEEGIKIYNDLHDKYQLEQLKLSENTTQVFAENSAHLILESEPEVVLAQLATLLNAR